MMSNTYKASRSQENKLHPGAGKAKNRRRTFRKFNNDTESGLDPFLTSFQSGQQTGVCTKHLSRLSGVAE